MRSQENVGESYTKKSHRIYPDCINAAIALNSAGKKIYKWLDYGNMMKALYAFFVIFIIVSFYLFIYERRNHHLLLITGCARSGTCYIATVLTANGIDVGHQRIKSKGMSSWDLASNPKKGRWKRYNLKKYKFDHIFHQIRHPLKVISSVYFSEDRISWNYIMSQIPEIHFRDPHLVKCAKYWYYWNLKAENLAEWSYRVEDLDQLWDVFSQKIGNRIDPNLAAHIPKEVNSIKKAIEKEFSWDDLEHNLDHELYGNIRALAQKYRYL